MSANSTQYVYQFGNKKADASRLELDLPVEVVHCIAKSVMAEQKVKLNYLVGTMIEVPQGVLTAEEIAQTAEFFSLGSNRLAHLAQTCLVETKSKNIPFNL